MVGISSSMAPERFCSSRTICADLLQHAQAERQERIDAGRLLPHHAGAQHQPVRDDLGLFRRLAQDRQEIAGQAHGILEKFGGDEVRVKADRPQKHKGCADFFGNLLRRCGVYIHARTRP